MRQVQSASSVKRQARKAREKHKTGVERGKNMGPIQSYTDGTIAKRCKTSNTRRAELSAFSLVLFFFF